MYLCLKISSFLILFFYPLIKSKFLSIDKITIIHDKIHRTFNTHRHYSMNGRTFCTCKMARILYVLWCKLSPPPVQCSNKETQYRAPTCLKDSVKWSITDIKSQTMGERCIQCNSLAVKAFLLPTFKWVVLWHKSRDIHLTGRKISRSDKVHYASHKRTYFWSLNKRTNLIFEVP